MQVYMLDNGFDYMAYWFVDDGLGQRLMGRSTGRVELPVPTELPLMMAPSFGDARKQPTALGDMHRFDGSCRLFSARAVDALSLSQSGQLFPVELEGRTEKFYWYWSTTVVDCLDETRSTRLLGDLQVPAFYEDRIGDAEIFTTPNDQKFQFNLFVTESFRAKIKQAKLKGFALKRSAFDPKPWKS
jgi:hypothetical protein